MPNRDQLAEFTAWCAQHIIGDEKSEAQIFLDRLFQAFGCPGGLKEAGVTWEMRVSKADGNGNSFADYAWKPVVLVEMKKRGTDLQKHYHPAFAYGTRLAPNRPRYVVLCNFDEFRVYDFDTDLDTFPWPQFELGSAPAPGAADRALAVGTGARTTTVTTAASPPSPAPPKGCRAGAATDTRGACAPQTIAKIDAVLASWSSTGSRNPAAQADYSTGRAAYGFSAKKDLLAQLLTLNQQVAAKIEPA